MSFQAARRVLLERFSAADLDDLAALEAGQHFAQAKPLPFRRLTPMPKPTEEGA